MTPSGARSGLLWMAVMLVAIGSVAEQIPSVEAAPGTVVRWDGSGTQECEMEGARWAPVKGTCWFAVDLLRSEGEIEVSRRVDGHREQARIEVGEYPYPVQYITLENDSQVHLSDENLARVGREQARIRGLWDGEGPARFELPLASPLGNRGSSGRFGSRRFFNNEPRSPHTGADYKAGTGEAVFSIADGTVALADDFFFSGISAFIDHGDGLVSMYFHFSEILVAEGEEVRRGQQIGRVGATGRATGPHLHFGVRWHGARIDPELLLDEPEAIPAIR